jgi:hypothetical protein
MKRIIYTLFVLFTVLPLLMAQVPKKILVEETTQASCPPCATFNPAFDALMEANTDKVVVMKYQVWWPGYDPMYLETQEDVNARVGDYLGANAAPNIYINGGNFESITSITQARIDQMYGSTTSPISIEIDHVLNDANGTIDATVTITNESANEFPANTYRLITVISEDDITYAVPPGTTSEREFKWVMKKMLPTAEGTMLTEAIAPGDSIEFTFSEPIPWHIKDLGELAVTAWVENPNVRGMVVQAEHSAHKPLAGVFPDLATSYTLDGYDGYCDTEVDAVFEIRNDGTEEVTSFDINALNPDGSLTLVDSWTGSLAVGAEQTVTIAGLQLAPGANSLTALITNINGKPDKNGHNALTDSRVLYVLNPDPFASELDEGFDIAQNGELPVNAIIDNPEGLRLFTVNQTITTAVNWPLGGHGLSDGCLRFDFPSGWPQGSVASLVFQKIDLSASEKTSLDFTYAYAARGGLSGDRITIDISSDCGDTWYTIYDKVGTDIITGNDPGSTARFYPRTTEWKDVNLDISQFDGEEEVILRFNGIGGTAQAYYLDDIIVMSNPTTSTINEDLMATIKTFPNPATDVVNIEFDLLEASAVNAVIYDATGRAIEVLAGSGQLDAGTQTMTWYPTNAGVYTVRLETSNGQASQRVTVVK